MIPKTLTSLAVKVKPGVRKSKILSYDDELNEAVIAVGAPADKGAANEELLSFLRSYFKKPTKLIVGKKSSKKIVKLG